MGGGRAGIRPAVPARLSKAKEGVRASAAEPGYLLLGFWKGLSPGEPS